MMKVLPAPSTGGLTPRRSTWTTPGGRELCTGDEFRHADYGKQPFAFIAYIDYPDGTALVEARVLPWLLARRKTAQDLRLGNVRTLSPEGVRR